MLIMSIFSKIMPIITLIVGVGLGLSITAFIYTFTVLRSARKDDEASSIELPDDMKELVSIYKEKYKDEKKKTIGDKFSVAITLSKDIVEDIAKNQFPESKFPVYELSIEEVLELNRYITRRLELLFDRKGLNVFKSVRVSQALFLLDIKDNVTELRVYKAYSKLGPKVKKALLVTKIINPFYWFKQVVVKLGVGISTNMICKEVIHIVAEESYKIYSKSLFEEKVTIAQIDQHMVIEEA